MGSEAFQCSGTAVHSSDCDGSCTKPLDLDALVAIDAKRTPGTWFVYKDLDGRIAYFSKGAGTITVATDIREEDKAAIVSAVNSLRPLIERCKRAEAERGGVQVTLDGRPLRPLRGPNER